MLKKICCGFLLVLSLLTMLSVNAGEVAAEVLEQSFISGATNKSALSYAAGEEMVFTFKFHMPAGHTPEKNWSLFYTRKGDDGEVFSGRVPANETLTVKTKLNRRGFVSVTVRLVDENNKFIAWKNRRNQARNISFFAGTAVEAEKLTDCGEPADFDQFWQKQRAKLAQVPFAGKVELTRFNKSGDVEIFIVKIPCAGPRPVTGFIGVPVNAQPKSLPCEIVFTGYGNTKLVHTYTKWSADRVKLLINAHGQEINQSKEYYDKFFASISSNGHSYAFDPIQNSDPETAFFNGMALRVMRALEYLKSRPEWNGRDLIARGGSQGGMQTVWAAALDSDVTEAYPYITWCCDLAGASKAQRLAAYWRIQYVPALDYYDPVFMAKRIKNAKVVITRAGLGDYICPPSGLAILYNNLATPDKTIVWVQGSDHGFVPKKSEVITWRSGK